MNSSADRYRHLFEYEQDSHRKVLGALAAAGEGPRSHEAFVKAVDMMAHIMAARRIWLYRLGGAAERPAGVFPKQVPLETLVTETDSMHLAWSDYYSRLTDAELGRVVDYQSLDGRPFRRSVEDILTQLYGHSLYHRGQISTWMREAGAEPAPTDYLLWCGEPDV